jgi:argininosuccinate synthase
LPEEAYPSQLQKKDEQQVQLTFSKGELIAVNKEQDLPHKCIEKLKQISLQICNR